MGPIRDLDILKFNPWIRQKKYYYGLKISRKISDKEKVKCSLFRLPSNSLFLVVFEALLLSYAPKNTNLQHAYRWTDFSIHTFT